MKLTCVAADSHQTIMPDTSGMASPGSRGSRVKNAKTLLASFFVTVPTVTPIRKVGPGLKDLQTRARRILAEKNAEKAEEKTWIGRMIAAENINDMKALIKSRDSE